MVFAFGLAVVWSALSSDARSQPAAGSPPAFDWQSPHARVLPTGDLEWAPQPFVFRPGPSVRYIDFEAGNDANPGTREAPWKHHPWDPAATGAAKESRGSHTYVFKRGVVYRGRFVVGDDRGQPGNPIQLTSDPSWGTGEAIVAGSERVAEWRRAAPRGMPNPDRVWASEVPFLPRTLWQVRSNGEIVRLTLARWPNWRESDPNDVLREWPVWENPEWWRDGSRFHRIRVGDRDRHLGIDTKNLTRPAEDYVGATVWTEWGIVMGSPYPAEVEAYDAAQKGLAFRGPWTFEMSEVIARGNRYHLEDKPWMLDEPGEFWVERLGENRARIYLRLPDDSDPNRAHIEAGRHIHMIDARQLHHVHISGLTFRFTNIHWQYNIPRWAHPDLMTAVVRLNGPGDDIVIRNNVFEHVHMPVRMQPTELDQRIGTVRIADNVMRETDHGAVMVGARFGNGAETRFAPLERVELLRNKMTRIGWRILSGEHGHAVDLNFPVTSHVAGNFLHRIAGWGLCIFGGKPSGVQGPEIPFNRHLMHHNRVEDVLVKSNDWGGIETWQGGPQYVFNNVVINPIAFKHWVWREGDPTNIGSFGHAYYLDAGFKHYYFNNIAAGRNNQLGTRSVNTTALQNIISFENTFWHNTFYKFAEATRQQEPSAGRFRYFSNVFDDVSLLAMRHADPRDVPPDPNASHYTQGGQFDYPSLAYRNNVFHNIRGRFGVFEETGFVYNTPEEFAAALKRLNAKAAEVGTTATRPPLVDPARRNFRPAPDSAALGKGTKVFVPWSLYGVAGEWHFTRNNADPSVVMDEHWYMTSNYNLREHYKDTPRYPLTAHGVGAGDYVAGTLEDWTAGALRLDGRSQYLSIPASRLSLPPVASAAPKTTDVEFGRVTAPAFVIPGRPFEIVVELSPQHAASQARADLHWLRREGYGGYMSHGGPGERIGDRRYRFRVEPTAPGGLDRYSILVWIGPDGTLENATARASVEVPRADFRNTLNPEFERTVDMGTNSFLIEAVVQTRALVGTLVSKTQGGTGYAVDLVEGRPRVRVTAGGQSYTLTSRASIANGAWRHLVVEVDRERGAVIYVDGRRTAADVSGAMPRVSLANGGDFFVGGGPGLPHLAGVFDFLRVSRGTLADAQTTIEELHAWQFRGPHFFDFAGTSRERANAAGALAR
ncbi:MAG: LamG-like jellyroll fold domain-containing protein [Fimbriimonadaceae bacterium]